MRIQDIRARRHAIPSAPGVYFFRDVRGRILYIGKANRLRQRILQYFSGHDTRWMIPHLLRDAHSVDWIVTQTPVEALILEAQMIRRHRPRYNTLLKDSRRLPYVRITTQDPYPKAEIVFEIPRDTAFYSGPYLSLGQARRVLQFLQRIFRIRTCDLPLDGQRTFPVCLLFHIQRCSGPCDHRIDAGTYRQDVQHAVRFLRGDRETVVRDLRQRMETHARNMEFEAAAFYRDAIQQIELWPTTLRIVDPAGRSIDLIGFTYDTSSWAMTVFMIRNGAFIDRREYTGTDPPRTPDDDEWWLQVLPQFYLNISQPPDEIWLPVALREKSLLEDWLAYHFHRTVRVWNADELSAADRDRLRWAQRNAAELHARAVAAGTAESPEDALHALKHLLHLPTLPYRIEAFDISNIQGQWNVAGMVVFEGGRPYRTHYRRFRIRTVRGADDYACMYEAVYRRLTGSLRTQMPLPDLVLIDGGKGQLNAARQAAKDAGLPDLPMIALAKREEVIFLPERREGIRLERHASALRLVQQIRDEAHRWAVRYYRKLHRKADLQMELTRIPGIGPRLARRLLDRFGTLERIRAADPEELARVIGAKRAARVHAWLHRREVQQNEEPGRDG